MQIAMTIFSGQPQLFASLSPSMKYPNRTYHQYYAKDQSAIGGSKGKALLITSQ
jgi:hypothetical protein